MEKKIIKRGLLFIGVILLLVALFLLTPAYAAETIYSNPETNTRIEITEEGLSEIENSLDTTLPAIIIIDTPTDPCDQPHETTVELDVIINGAYRLTDWGPKGCRWDGFKVFNKPGSVEIGFRNDGIMVWRYGKEAGK